MADISYKYRDNEHRIDSYDSVVSTYDWIRDALRFVFEEQSDLTLSCMISFDSEDTFNMRKWDRSDRAPSNAYQCYSSVRTGSYESRKKKGLPLDGICQSPMIPEWRLQMMANLIFRKYLSDKDKVLALANSILEAHIGDKEEEENVTALLHAKQEELTRLNKKLDAYIEMRSEGEISRDLFRSKCSEVEAKIEKLQEEIETLSAAAEPKAVVDYTEKLTVLQYALEQYTQCMEGVNVPDSVIEAFVTKIVVSKDSFDWYLRFDGDPDKPLRCQISGKRRQNTKIMVAGELSPAVDDGGPGCHQGNEVIPGHHGKPVYLTQQQSPGSSEPGLCSACQKSPSGTFLTTSTAEHFDFSYDSALTAS